MERQLLDPVGSESVAGVVRRLSAVLSMDESLAERGSDPPYDVASRRAVDCAGAGEGHQGLRLPRVDALSLTAGRRHLSGPAIGWAPVGAAELDGLLPADAIGLADFRATVRDALNDGPLTLAELGDVLTKRRPYKHLKPVFDDGAGTLIKPLTWQGDMGFQVRLATDGRRFSASTPTHGGTASRISRTRVRAPSWHTCGHTGRPPAMHIHYWLGDGLSAGPADSTMVLGTR